MNKKLLLKLFHYLKPFWKHFGVVLGLIFATQAFGLLTPYLFAKMFDAKSFGEAMTYVGASFLLWFLVSSVLSTARSYWETKYIVFDTDKHLNHTSLSKLLGLSIGQHRNQHSGVKQHVITQGQNSIDQLVQMLLFDVAPSIIQTLSTIILIVIVSPIVGIWVTAMTTIFLYFSIKRNFRYKSKILSWLDKDKNQSKMVSEVYRNVPLVILEAQENKSLNQVDQAIEETAEYAKSLWIPFIKESALLRAILGLARFGGIGIAMYLTFNGSFSKGMLFAFISWIQQSLGNVENISQQQRRVMIMLGKTKKYHDLLEMETDVPTPTNPIQPESFDGKIEFRNVSYAYPKRNSDAEQEIDSSNSLSSISFTVNPGEKIGIVGESGSGKSTLVNLIRRSFDPKDGCVLIDDIPLSNLDLHSFRSNLGNVEQDVAVFDLSIRDNILYGMNGKATTVSDVELRKVAQTASIEQFIEKLEHGFDTMVGEKGIKLSGGERQRIAIARALIKNPKILIFDEATSALDAYNEKLVHDAMNEASVGRTTIIIAHRLSTVIDADRIIVMKDGKIDDIGTHHELHSRCDEYQKLIKNQVVTI